MSSKEFKKQLDKELQAIVDQASDAVAKTGVYGWNLVTVATPVLTGRARASWLLNVDRPSDATVAKVKSKKRVYSDPKEPSISFDITRNNAIVISNNVEYVEYLEDGTDQIPAFAMVATAKPKIDKELQRRLKKIK